MAVFHPNLITCLFRCPSTIGSYYAENTWGFNCNDQPLFSRHVPQNFVSLEGVMKSLKRIITFYAKFPVWNIFYLMLVG